MLFTPSASRATLVIALSASAACTGTFGGGPSGPGSGGSDVRQGSAATANDEGRGGASDGAGADTEGSGSTAEPSALDASIATADAAVTGAGDGSGSGGGGPVITDPTGLPCEVSDMVSQHCVGCHRDPPIGGAHVALLTIDAFRAQSPSNNALDVGHDALARIKSTGSNQMPPGGARVDAATIAAFEAWVNGGMQPGDCGSLVDAGVAQPDPAFAGPSVCTSNQRWTFGDSESPLMHPGVACIDCHSRKDGPSFSLAGTLFPTGHEPNDCLGVNGSAAQARVEVTDANGKVVRMSPNQNGNFYSTSGVTFPITAKVIYDGRERAMLTPVPSGDCNGCHTDEGSSGAPGRIALP